MINAVNDSLSPSIVIYVVLSITIKHFTPTGIFIQYPTLRENVNFISDVGQAVISCLDPSTSPATSTGQQGVRVKAAWAFGNLSESL